MTMLLDTLRGLTFFVLLIVVGGGGAWFILPTEPGRMMWSGYSAVFVLAVIAFGFCVWMHSRL